MRISVIYTSNQISLCDGTTVMGWARHVARMAEREMHEEFW